MGSLEDYPAEEIEGIWKRIKRYIDTGNVRSINRRMIEEELENEMMNTSTSNDQYNTQSNMEFLVSRDFAKAAVSNPRILNELLERGVKEIKVKGKSRFQIAKGTPTFTKQGKKVRAGQFVKGGSKSEAVENLTKSVNS